MNIGELVDQDFDIHAGDRKVLKVTVTDSGGSPVSLNGLTDAQWQMAESYTPSSGSLITKTLSGDLSVTDAQNGIMQIDIYPTDTASLAGNYVHELQIIDNSGNPSTIMVGTVRIRAGLI